MADPWFKFYPSDWRSDPALRVCSLAARGLWMEMLCVMHEATPRGTLRINGAPMTAKQIAALVGAGVGEAQRCLDELEAAGVYSRDDNRVIFSRRMMRDTEKALRDKANGKGGGNPSIKRGVNPPVNRQDKAQIPEARDQNQKEKSHPSGARPTADDAVTAVAIYHDVAESQHTGWPSVQRLTPQRRSAVLARWRECGGEDGWRAAMERAARSAFLRGANDSGWRADFDFFCQAKSFTKLLEGSYDDHKPSGSPAAAGTGDAFRGSLARIVEARAQPGGSADDGVPRLAGPAPGTGAVDDDLEIPGFLRRQ
jgi:hypothetical protein